MIRIHKKQSLCDISLINLLPWESEQLTFPWCCTVHISLHGVPSNSCRCYFCFTFSFELEMFQSFSDCSALFIGKPIYRQQWSNAHVTAEPGYFNGRVCHFPFTLSFIFRPGALRIWPYPLPEQHTTPTPCSCKAWTEERRTSNTSRSSCWSRLTSSSGMAERLRISSCTQSTSTGTALCC